MLTLTPTLDVVDHGQVGQRQHQVRLVLLVDTVVEVHYLKVH